MEDKKSGSGLLKWVIIALLLWFAYDNLLAKHWTVNWELKTFRYDCGYKCKYSYNMLDYCKDY